MIDEETPMSWGDSIDVKGHGGKYVSFLILATHATLRGVVVFG